MPRFPGRIHGTINSEFDVEADTEDDAREKALEEWSYVEFEDLWVNTIDEQGETTE